MKTVTTARFGQLEYDERDVIHLPGGLIGLPDLKDWIMLDMEEGIPMKWMQSVDRGDFGVPVMEPHFFSKLPYEPRIPNVAWQNIGAGPEGDVVQLIIATIHPGGSRITGNMLAPLVIHTASRRGGQVTLDGEEYSVRQELDYLKFGLAVASPPVENDPTDASGVLEAHPEEEASGEKLEVEL